MTRDCRVRREATFGRAGHGRDSESVPDRARPAGLDRTSPRGAHVDGGLTDDGLPYLVMELVDGQRIDRYCDEHELSIRKRIELVVQICDAVESIHQAGILHRDLSAANILVTPQGIPKLVDFGIAKVAGTACRIDGLDAANRDGGDHGNAVVPVARAGVRRHADRRHPDRRLHAGCAALSPVDRAKPVSGVALANLLDEIRSSDPVPPCRLDSDIPRSLETICLKCLQKEPRRRYRSARELADDLRLWLDDRPVKARPDSLVDKGWRWCRRRPAVAALLLSLVATIVASVVGLTMLLRLSEMERDGAVAARLEAEDSLDSASRSLDQVVELLTRALSAPASIATDLPETFFQSACDEERKMLGSIPDCIGQCSGSRLGLARLKRLFGVAIDRKGSPHESRLLFLEALAVLEDLGAENSNDNDLLGECYHTILALEQIAIRSGEIDGVLHTMIAALGSCGQCPMLDYGSITSATCPTACDSLQMKCGRRATSQAGGDCWKPIFKCSTRYRNPKSQTRNSRSPGFDARVARPMGQSLRNIQVHAGVYL